MFDETNEIRQSSTGQEVLAMIKRHPIVTISIIVLLVLGGVFFAYRSSQATASTTKPDKAAEKKEEKKLPVEISVAKKGSISSWILTTATLEPDSQVTIV